MNTRYNPKALVPCRYCGKSNLNIDQTCDFCWELKHRMMMKPELAAKILKEIQA